MLYMATYDYLKNRFTNSQNISFNSDNFPFWACAISGGIARVMAVSVGAPVELFRTLKMSKKLHYSEIRSLLRLKTQTDGFKIYFNGFMPNLYRDVPFSILYWPLLEKIKFYLDSKSGPRDNHDVYSNFRNSFLAGTIAGSVCTIATQPFDTIKTLKQVSALEHKSKFFSIHDAYTKLRLAKNNQIFYSGLLMRLTKVPLACAILISSFNALNLVYP